MKARPPSWPKPKRRKKEIIEDRRHIHQNPEVGFYLPDTADYIRKRLGQMGIASGLWEAPLTARQEKIFWRRDMRI